ncbi:hypothetical protein L1O48_09490 [Ligilactobacillus equi]|uniref:hypothetical protein n=1 Tax=Ligilactobacillus equi TaxID=137357 RepID=UPI002ED0A502
MLIRPITANDDAAMATIIRQQLTKNSPPNYGLLFSEKFNLISNPKTGRSA